MVAYKDPYPNAAAMRRRYALQLLEEASKNSPVQHPLQALARAIQGSLGGYYASQLQREHAAKHNSVAAVQPQLDATLTEASAEIPLSAIGSVPLPRPIVPVPLPRHQSSSALMSQTLPPPAASPLPTASSAAPLMTTASWRGSPESFQPSTGQIASPAAPTLSENGFAPPDRSQIFSAVERRRHVDRSDSDSITGKTDSGSNSLGSLADSVADSTAQSIKSVAGSAGGLLSPVIKKVRDTAYVRGLGDEADRLADLLAPRVPNDRHTDEGSRNYHLRNAVKHAYTSAVLQRDYGHRLPHAAELLGYLLEYRNTNDPFPDQAKDSWKDLWNNAIGRQIGDFARRNNLSQRDLELLIQEAWERGDLIKSIHDSRIPKDGLGLLHEFPRGGVAGAPVWAGVYPEWKPRPGPGIAKMPLPNSPAPTPRSLPDP